MSNEWIRFYSSLFTHSSSLFRPHDRIDHRDDLDRGFAFGGGNLDHPIRHQRLASMLLPPASDEDVVADLADGQLAGRGASVLAELHDEKIAVLDAVVGELFASRAEDDLA